MPSSARVREAARRRVRAARERVQGGAWAIAQCAIGGGLAWTLATVLFDHPRPFFASVAAVVCLGMRAAQRLRRVAELAVGVTVGVAVGDALVDVIGRGAWQISLVVAVAMLLALAIDGGALLTAQAGLQAVFVVALPPVPGGQFARWEDALVGGATALLVAALLPANPWRPVHRTARAALTSLAEVLRTCAAAVRNDDTAQAAFALAGARSMPPAMEAWAEALRTGQEISRLSPLRPDQLDVWREQTALASGLDRAALSVRAMVRRVLFALGGGDPLPAALPELLDELAAIVERLADDLEGGRGRLLLDAAALAARLDPVALGVSGLSGWVVLGQFRAAVVDLLEGAGVDPDRARAALPPAG